MTPVKRGLVVAAILVLAASVSAQEEDQAKAKKNRIFGQLTSYLELNQDDERGEYTKFKQIAAINVEGSKVTIGAQAA